MPPKNSAILNHTFLAEMFKDSYFPKELVEKGKQVLLELCARIEREQPKEAPAIYALTEQATERFNVLAVEFEAHDSEIETAARECIAEDFGFILKTYGFEVDLETA